MRVLVTGASGFVGSHVAEALAAAGHELRLALRPTSSLEFLGAVNFERVAIDLRDAESLRLATAGVDAVVHLAGVTAALKASEYFAVNGQGTASLVRAAATAGVKRFVYLSSLSAQGPSPDDGGAMPEVPRPISIYGRSKLSAEADVLRLQDRLTVTVVRAPVVYGPRDRGLLPFFRLGKLRLLPVYGDGENRLSWIHGADLAAALTATLDGQQSGAVYTASDGPSHSWRELALALGEALGKKPLILGIPPAVYGLAGTLAGLGANIVKRPLLLNRDKVLEMRQKFWVCNSERITKDLGWRPSISVEAGLKGTVDWYRQQRWL